MGSSWYISDCLTHTSNQLLVVFFHSQEQHVQILNPCHWCHGTNAILPTTISTIPTSCCSIHGYGRYGPNDDDVALKRRFFIFIHIRSSSTYDDGRYGRSRWCNGRYGPNDDDVIIERRFIFFLFIRFFERSSSTYDDGRWYGRYGRPTRRHEPNDDDVVVG